MALEAIGVGLGVGGLAGLLDATLNAADRVRAYRHFDDDSKILSLQFEAATHKLRQWQITIKPGSDGESAIWKQADEQIKKSVSGLLEVAKAAIPEAGLSEADGVSTDSRDASSAASGSRHTGADPGGEAIELAPMDALITPQGRSNQITASGRLFQLPYRTKKVRWALKGKEHRQEQVEQFSQVVDWIHQLVPTERGSDMAEKYEADQPTRDGKLSKAVP